MNPKREEPRSKEPRKAAFRVLAVTWAFVGSRTRAPPPSKHTRSAGCPPAVHRQRRPVYVRRLGPAEESDDLGNLFGLDEAFDSGRFQYDLLDHLMLGDPVRAGLV